MDFTLTAPASLPPQTLRPAKTSYRIDSIDLLRGLVMIIMALDHTRDFFHSAATTGDPLNLATTTPILYFTRWITHLCAPTFVFLSGTSGYFQSLRKSKKELSVFLIKRGLWLILIDITVMSFAFTFDIHFGMFGMQTLWAIGMSMIILGLVIWLPFAAIFILGLIIVLGHDSLDFYEKTLPNFQSDPGWFYSLLHRPHIYNVWDNHNLFVLYPFLPWAGLMMLGYCFGKLFLKYEGAERRKVLIWLGLGILLFFAILRYTNAYGNPPFGKWSTQKNGLYTFLSFMNVNKYPPSLLYMCATIGISILFLAFIGNVKNSLTRFITVYGRVPFFYYILHFYWLHIIAAIFFLANGHSFSEGLNMPGFLVSKFCENNLPGGGGYSLLVVYGVWLFVVLSLYPLCKWFSDYKMKHREKRWLSYL